MKMVDLSSICFLFLLVNSFISCSDNKEAKEVYPIRFPNSSYEVRIGMRESISFVDGSGDYTVRVENPQLLEAFVSSNTDNLFINAKKKGETELFITDNGVGETVKLQIKTTDIYLGFVLGNSNIPDFKSKTDLFLVKNDPKEFYLFDQAEDSNEPAGEPILKGIYEISIESKVPYLTLTYKNKAGGTEISKLGLSGSDGFIFDVLNTVFELGWKKSGKSSRSVGPQIYTLRLKDVNTSYEAQGHMDYFMHMPEGVLK